MEANKILSADVLDIIFEGRNKEYGAYNLRKTYNRRLVKAMAGMMAVTGALCIGYVMASNVKTVAVRNFVIEDPTLSKVEEPKVVTPPPPPKQVIPPKIQTIKYTDFNIVPDKDMKEPEAPPENTALDDVKIGTFTQDGVKDDLTTAPPQSDDRGILEAPKKPEASDDVIFRKVEIESTYPGGAGAWMRYLNKTVRYPEEAQNIEMQGTVTVQFIVDQEGNVSDVEALEGPTAGGLREEAVRVIKKSGKWEPAIQNGRKVKSYKKQPIIFRLNVE